MKHLNNKYPPKWPLQLLRWIIKKEYLEEIEGDMEEIFQDDLEQFSAGKARRKYTIGVLKLIRPNIIKSVFNFHPFISLDMLSHHLKLIFRNIKRYKSSFLINLIGLSTGLACVLFIFLWVTDELSKDKFHDKDDRLYQVMHNLPQVDEILTIEPTPGILAKALEEDFPEVEAAAVVSASFGDEEVKGIISNEELQFKASEMYVSKNFFEVFSYQLLTGNSEDVLTDKNAVLISDEIAKKLFGNTKNIIGKSINWDEGRLSGLFTITGIFKKPPAQSTQQFDVLFSYQKMFEEYERLHSWRNSDPSTFVLLKEGVQLESFNEKLKKYSIEKSMAANKRKTPENSSIFFLQKFSDRYLKGNYENGQIAGGRISYVRLFSMIALFILIIACINFMNLSTAKATRRLKEIGVKKVIGASRKSLINQFLLESLLLTFLSLLLAIGLVMFFLPNFNVITGKELGLNFSMSLISKILLISLLTGLLAGSYPALYLSRFKPVSIFKGKINASIGEIWARRGLVVFQFVVSIVLIVAVTVVYKQIEYINNKNLGFNKDNIITFPREGNLDDEMDSFLEEIKNIPGVIEASSFGHDLVGDYGGTTGLAWPGKEPDEVIRFANLEVDYDLIKLLGFEIKKGRTFSKDFGTEESTIIFNESAIEAMGLEEPVGQTIKLWGKDRQIVGVVKDFHFESLYEDVGPCFFQCYPGLNEILVKIRAGNEAETIAGIKKLYTKFTAGLPFEYRFLDEDFETLYAAENRVAILSRYFAGIAILISCLGLFGLASFTAERRLKEIGIRKILGSSNFSIVQLLSKDFSAMVLIAILIALPISYLLTRNWIQSFAYRIDLEWWFFVGAGLLTMLIAWSTVALQTYKAARINPVQCLKEE